ncbi:hypothetical protein GCM10025868_09230 [Angustibacter aerolatus]|uniref:NADP-dependent oxidoreductase domain-containing protein n=1 Tax=Angustibacter aerolatus TaxID=1162965 RepID=A0ABQ6JBW9_9ACTN|nr:hypothetical protein [Angustibacter aerolatus]GMA85673.1 hypothetical protein GCM10025868_09230 [Angustibacter aerolatus]
MRLAGPGVFGPRPTATPPSPCCARRSSLGIDHVDTSDFYGPHVTNEIIREALAPYPEHLHLVTKVGARRDAQGGWPHARTPDEPAQRGPRQPAQPGARAARRREPADGRRRRSRAGQHRAAGRGARRACSSRA